MERSRDYTEMLEQVNSASCSFDLLLIRRAWEVGGYYVKWIIVIHLVVYYVACNATLVGVAKPVNDPDRKPDNTGLTK